MVSTPTNFAEQILVDVNYRVRKRGCERARARILYMNELKSVACCPGKSPAISVCGGGGGGGDGCWTCAITRL